MESRATSRRARRDRLCLCDLPLRGATLWCAFHLSRPRQTERLFPDANHGPVVCARYRRGFGFRRRSARWCGGLPGSMEWLDDFKLAGFDARRNSGRCAFRCAHRGGGDAFDGTANAVMVLATYPVRPGTYSHGSNRVATAKSVSLSRCLDFATLDSGDWSRLPHSDR